MQSLPASQGFVRICSNSSTLIDCLNFPRFAVDSDGRDSAAHTAMGGTLSAHGWPTWLSTDNVDEVQHDEICENA
jgi:hypothetical protein